MPRDLDLSRAICRVCGEDRLLAADIADVARELSAFTERHNHPDAFHIEIVVASHHELSEAEDIPRQRA